VRYPRLPQNADGVIRPRGRHTTCKAGLRQARSVPIPPSPSIPSRWKQPKITTHVGDAQLFRYVYLRLTITVAKTELQGYGWLTIRVRSIDTNGTVLESQTVALQETSLRSGDFEGIVALADGKASDITRDLEIESDTKIVIEIAIEGVDAGATITAVLEEYTTTLPQSLALDQNYPNPFNNGTVIRFSLPGVDDVELSVYNLRGFLDNAAGGTQEGRLKGDSTTRRVRPPTGPADLSANMRLGNDRDSLILFPAIDVRGTSPSSSIRWPQAFGPVF
jgi:hypothetical protein